MFPFLPPLPNNVQGCGGLPPQQMMLPDLQQQVCNPCSQPNPVGFGGVQQIQSQLHAYHQFQNPQVSAFNNQNMDNVHGSSMVMSSCPQLTPSPSLACTPNVPLTGQTSFMGMQPQQGHPYLHPNPQNVNQIAALPFHGQICNVPQALNQLGVPQLSAQFGISSQMQSVNQAFPFPQGEQLWPQNLSQNLNQIMGLHGQLCSQNPIQILNRIKQLSQQAVGTTQPGPFNVPQSSLLVAAAQGSQNAFLSNSHLVPMNADFGFGNALISTDPTKSKGQSQDTFINMTVLSQNAGQKSLPAIQNPPSLLAAVPTKANETHKSLPFDSVRLGQVSHNKNGKHDFSAAKFGNSAYRNFNKNHHGIVKRDQSNRRFQKPNHHMANAGSFPSKWGKGLQNERAIEPQSAKYENRRPDKFQSRVLTLKYTEEEIKQWCEARKRNFPTTANIERKKRGSSGNCEGLNENAKIRRQQLKEVLAKQMELGFEPAEVPSHYLSDPGSIPRNGKKETHVVGRFPDKYGKRGRHGPEKWQSKRHKSRDEASPVPVPRKREPTLLQKLLSSEIKRDRSQLLQVLRFMTLNSFFEHWPDNPLEYPKVAVKDGGCKVDCAEGEYSHGEGSTTSGVGKNFGAEKVHGQAEGGTGDGAEESANESICTRDGDGVEENGDSVVS